MERSKKRSNILQDVLLKITNWGKLIDYQMLRVNFLPLLGVREAFIMLGVVRDRYGYDFFKKFYKDDKLWKAYFKRDFSYTVQIIPNYVDYRGKIMDQSQWMRYYVIERIGFRSLMYYFVDKKATENFDIIGIDTIVFLKTNKKQSLLEFMRKEYEYDVKKGPIELFIKIFFNEFFVDYWKEMKDKYVDFFDWEIIAEKKKLFYDSLVTEIQNLEIDRSPLQYHVTVVWLLWNLYHDINGNIHIHYEIDLPPAHIIKKIDYTFEYPDDLNNFGKGIKDEQNRMIIGCNSCALPAQYRCERCFVKLCSKKCQQNDGHLLCK